MYPRSAENPVLQIEIFPDILAGSSVIAVREVLDQGIDIRVGIPHQLGKNPGAHLSQLTRDCLIITFFQYPDGVIVSEILDVRRDGLPVGDWQGVLGEIGHIVPNVEMGGYRRPIPEILEEINIARAIVIVVEQAALDAAKTNDHVIPRNDILRGVAGVLIRESTDKLIRELIFDGIRNLVDKPDHQA